MARPLPSPLPPPPPAPTLPNRAPPARPGREPPSQPPPVGTGFRRADLWRGLGLAAATFVLLFALGVAVFEAVEPDPSANVEDAGVSLIVLVVDLVALVAVPVAVLGGRRRGLPLLGLRRPTAATAGWAALALAGAYGALWIYLGLIATLGLDDLEPVSAIDADLPFSPAAAVLTGLLVILVAPVAEEIFHRGFLAGALTRLWGRWVALPVSAALFSALHFDVGSLIPFFAIGLVFAGVYLRSRDLGATILAHLVFNLIAFTVTLSDRGVA